MDGFAKIKTICLILLVIAVGKRSTYIKKDLSKELWLLINDTIALPTNIPASVHTTLLHHHLITDPYVGFNDVKYAWIPDQDLWVYQTTFQIEERQLFGTLFARLRLLGIDTIATVYFNGKVVGKVDNMFKSWSFPLKHLKYSVESENLLSIHFESPTQYALNQSVNYSHRYGYKVPPNFAPEVQHGRDHPNFIRKEQCSFSWDWGPSFPTIGVWGPVFLEASLTVFLNDVKVTTLYETDLKLWLLTFEVVIESYISQNSTISHGFELATQKSEYEVTSGTKTIVLTPIKVLESDVQRWWPNGYGQQILYNGFVVIDDDDDGSAIRRNIRFGFRTVELVEEPIDGSKGLSFYFKINSHPIFLKGANWIPADSFQERVTSEVLEDLFESALAANINALRVWGGGVYEQDKFYELADEKGILIWQDLMFAVALYPVNKEFLASVNNEIQYQIQRLHHHPSIIAWSGNNENEAAIAQTWWPEVKTNHAQLVADYGKLYAETIQPVISQEDKTRPYLMSSPSNGIVNHTKDHISKNPQNSLFGDVHFYDYKKDCWNPATFPNPRFASEYGYQSYPSFEAMSSVAPSDDLLKWNSSFLYHRQHHKNGNEEIEEFIKQHYDLPLVKDDKEYLRYMIYLSQIVQATCIKYESEHYRRLQDNLINGQGHTMGALYWQLNDIWQAPSWASIEYGGRWKMLHYYVRHFFDATSVSAYLQNDTMFVYMSRDHPNDSAELVLRISAFNWNSFSPVFKKQITVEMSKKHSVEIYQKSIEKDGEASFLYFELMEENSENVIAQTELFLMNFTANTLQDPKLQIVNMEQVTDKEIQFTVQAQCPVAFVWFETSFKGRFSNNGFIMHKTNVTITFYGRTSLKVEDFQKSLKTMSLYDAYKT